MVTNSCSFKLSDLRLTGMSTWCQRWRSEPRLWKLRTFWILIRETALSTFLSVRLFSEIIRAISLNFWVFLVLNIEPKQIPCENQEPCSCISSEILLRLWFRNHNVGSEETRILPGHQSTSWWQSRDLTWEGRKCLRMSSKSKQIVADPPSSLWGGKRLWWVQTSLVSRYIVWSEMANANSEGFHLFNRQWWSNLMWFYISTPSPLCFRAS